MVLLWYQWKEETHSYTLAANIRVLSLSYRKSREEVASISLFEGRVTENVSGRLNLISMIKPIIAISLGEFKNLVWRCLKVSMYRQNRILEVCVEIWKP